MFPAVINHLWQSTLFACGIGVLTLMLRRNRAGVRFALWFCASMKFLFPLALLATIGSHIPHGPPIPHLAAGGTRVLKTVLDVIAAPMSATGQLVGSMPPLAPSVHPWWNLLGVIWVFGVFAMTGYWVVGWTRIRRALAASTPMAIAFPIPVRTSSVMQEPAVAGIVRPATYPRF
jgi:bla regulator protein blaR1